MRTSAQPVDILTLIQSVRGSVMSNAQDVLPVLDLIMAVA